MVEEFGAGLGLFTYMEQRLGRRVTKAFVSVVALAILAVCLNLIYTYLLSPTIDVLGQGAVNPQRLLPQLVVFGTLFLLYLGALHVTGELIVRRANRKVRDQTIAEHELARARIAADHELVRARIEEYKTLQADVSGKIVQVNAILANVERGARLIMEDRRDELGAWLNEREEGY